PLRLVDEPEQLLEADGVAEAGLSAGEDIAQQSGLRSECAQRVHVMVRQLRAALGEERGPVAVRRQVDAALVGHLEEEQIGDLLDVVAVVDPVVAEGVAEPPESLDNVTHAAIASLISRTMPSNRPPNTRLALPQPPIRERIGMLSKSARSMDRFSATNRRTPS